MRIHLYVVPYPVSRFPDDRGESFLVLWSVSPPGACPHVIEDPPSLRQAKMEAKLMHQHGVNCGGTRHAASTH